MIDTSTILARPADDDLVEQSVNQRSDELYADRIRAIYKRTDLLFAGLFIFQWLAGIAAAFWISPRTWAGQQNYIHLHVYAAAFMGLAIISFPLFLIFTRPGTALTRHVIAIAQMLASALLIHLTGGRIETHFHVFGSLAFLAFYNDWRVLLTASLVVAVDHFIRGVYFPISVFGVLMGSEWRWLEHAGWVVFEDIFLVITCLRNQRDIRDTTFKQACIDEKNVNMATVIDQLKQLQAETEIKNQVLAQKNQELIDSHKQADSIFSALMCVLPGTVLDDKYQLEEQIGSGGYGAVYRGKHLVLKRSVAVKVFRPAHDIDSVEGLARFRSEAVSTCRINHPNAVSVLDTGISKEGIAYIVMELLEGRTLTTELQEFGRLSVARTCNIAISVCKVLAEAHRVNLIHRDIKPDNIFLHNSPEGEVVKVVDFGIAKLTESAKSSHNYFQTLDAVIGTPVYMSPERLSRKGYSSASDIYSLGIVMYEMLAGYVPFDAHGHDLMDLVLMHLNEKPMPLSHYVPDIPAELAEAIGRALEKDPHSRPSADEMIKLLMPFSDQYTCQLNPEGGELAQSAHARQSEAEITLKMPATNNTNPVAVVKDSRKISVKAGASKNSTNKQK